VYCSAPYILQLRLQKSDFGKERLWKKSDFGKEQLWKSPLAQRTGLKTAPRFPEPENFYYLFSDNNVGNSSPPEFS
jgi:hypothetical protein